MKTAPRSLLAVLVTATSPQLSAETQANTTTVRIPVSWPTLAGKKYCLFYSHGIVIETVQQIPNPKKENGCVCGAPFCEVFDSAADVGSLGWFLSAE